MTTDDPAVVRELESLYAAVEADLRRGELTTVEGLLTSDFEAVGEDGEPVGRAEVLGHFRAMATELRDIRWPRRVLALERRGDDVVATVEGTFSATSADGASVGQPISALTRAEDTWVKTPDGWKNRAARSLATGSLGG